MVGQAGDILEDAGAGTLAEIEHRRNQDQSPYAYALLGLQLAHDPGCADAAIALADDEFGREQAIGLLQPAADRDRKRLDVAVDREKPLACIIVAHLMLLCWSA